MQEAGKAWGDETLIREPKELAKKTKDLSGTIHKVSAAFAAGHLVNRIGQLYGNTQALNYHLAGSLENMAGGALGPFGGPFRIAGAMQPALGARAAGLAQAPFKALSAGIVGAAVAGPAGPHRRGRSCRVSDPERSHRLPAHGRGEHGRVRHRRPGGPQRPATGRPRRLPGGAELARLGAELEKTRITFEVLTGSKFLGDAFLGAFQRMATSSPYTVKGLTDTAQVFLGMGVGLDRLLPLMKQLGDIALGDEGRMHRLAVAVGEVMAEGRLTSFRFRQFATLGIGEADFAKAMGKSITEFRAALHSGEVGANTLFKVLQQLTSEGGRFGNATQRALAATQNQWNVLTSTLEVKGGLLGETLLKRFDVAGGIGKAIAFVNDNWKTIETTVIKVADTIKYAFDRAVDFVLKLFEKLSADAQGWWKKAFGEELSFDSVKGKIGVVFDYLEDRIPQMIDRFKTLLGGLWTWALPKLKDLGLLNDPEASSRAGVAGSLIGAAAAGGGVAGVEGHLMGAIASRFVGGAGEAPNPRGAADAWNKIRGEIALAGGLGVGMGNVHSALGGGPLDALKAGVSDVLGPKTLDFFERNFRPEKVLSGEAKKIMDDAVQKNAKGWFPMDQFNKEVKHIQEAMNPPPLGHAFVPGIGLLPIPGRGEALDPKLGGRMLAEAFDKQKQALGGDQMFDWSHRLPRAALRGTAEAQDIINQATVGPRDTLEAVKSILGGMSDVQIALKELVDQKGQALLDIMGKGPKVVGGGV
jgi:hypothetical protein